jgi:hypothetical protein
MARGPLRLPANFKVKCFGSQRNVNGIDKYVAPDPRSGMEEVEIISKTRLKDSASWPARRDIPASDATVESAPIGSTGKKRNRRNLRIALATAAAEEIDDSGALRKKRVTSMNVTRRWQEVWSARFTWAEGEFDSSGNLTGVVCVICSKIEGRKKIIVSKGDNLEKHEGKRLCVQAGIPYLDLEVGDIFTKKDCKHFKNQQLWSARQNAPTMYKQLLRGLHGENTRKRVKFSTLFQILSHGHPMVDYCESQHLLRYLNVKNVPKKHWCETSGWEMSEHIEVVVLDALRKLIRGYTIFSLSAHEVTAIDMT